MRLLILGTAALFAACSVPQCTAEMLSTKSLQVEEWSIDHSVLNGSYADSSVPEILDAGCVALCLGSKYVHDDFHNATIDSCMFMDLSATGASVYCRFATPRYACPGQ